MLSSQCFGAAVFLAQWRASSLPFLFSFVFLAGVLYSQFLSVAISTLWTSFPCLPVRCSFWGGDRVFHIHLFALSPFFLFAAVWSSLPVKTPTSLLMTW